MTARPSGTHPLEDRLEDRQSHARSAMLLIDGNSMLYRAYYALPRLTNSKGIPTGAVYGFTRMLFKLLRERNPDFIACAFDKGKRTFRHRRAAEYKATRRPTPDDLLCQLPWTKRVLQGMRIPYVEDEEFEADDLLATLAVRGAAAGLEVVIVTGDKDIFQIVSPAITVLRFRKGISQHELIAPEGVQAHLGVAPEQVVDFLALSGDTSDNIPGVPGIGPVTARRLLQSYSNLANILRHQNELSTTLQHRLQTHLDQLHLSRELATLNLHTPLPVDPLGLARHSPDRDILQPLLEELEFTKLAAELPPDPNGISPTDSSESDRAAADPPEPESAGDDPPGQTSPKPSSGTASGTPGAVYLLVLTAPAPGLAALLSDRPDPLWLPRDELAHHPAFENISALLQNPSVPKIGHSIKAAAAWLDVVGLLVKGWTFDTALAAYVLDTSKGRYPLTQVADTYLPDVPGQAGESPGPEESLRLLHDLYPVLRNRLQEQKLGSTYFEVELPLIEVLLAMEARGILIDQTVLAELTEQISQQRAHLEQAIYTRVGAEFNLNSPTQLADMLFGRLNLPRFKRTKTGYSTDEETLQALTQQHPWVEQILEHRHLSKLLSTYLKPMARMTDPVTARLHTTFNQTVTATGRLSSSQPNLQNIPVRGRLGERIRRCFVAPAGWRLLSADYSQVELRILAHLSADSALIASFRQGDDIHLHTAAEIHGILPLMVTPAMRRQAKAVNFGIIYGISPYGLAKSLGITEHEADSFIRTYFDRYPKVKEYIDRTIDGAREQGFVTTLLGLTRPLPDLRVSSSRRRQFAQRTAINTPIQGTAADLIKRAMVALYQRLRRENLDARMVLQIHDELLLEVPQSQIDATRKIVIQEMEHALELTVPLVVDTKIGPNWAEMKA